MAPDAENQLPDHAALVHHATSGDFVSLETLIQQHLSALRAFIRLRTNNRVRQQESESDLVQSVCREVIASARNFDYRGAAAFKSWLFTTALNKILEKHDYYSAQKRDVAKNVPLHQRSSGCDDHLLGAYASVFTPSRAAQAHEELERVERTFDQLPDEYREVITLARVVGLTHAEIAAQMGRTEQASRQLLKRAMVRLAVLLESP